MTWKKLIKPGAAAVGCFGAAIAAPHLAPLLVPAALPFFGTLMTSLFSDQGLGTEGLKKLSDVFTNLSASGFQQLPGALTTEHNFNLERMLATAYRNALQELNDEIKSGKDEVLTGQAADTIPLVIARINRGLAEPSLLFPVQANPQPGSTAYANQFTAEKLQIMLADPDRWTTSFQDEVEIALRRWLNEERNLDRPGATFGLNPDRPIVDPLRTSLRDELPRRIPGQINHLVAMDGFSKSWVAFQRAYLQSAAAALNRIEDVQGEVKKGVSALSDQISNLAQDDAFAAALAKKLGEFLGSVGASEEQIAQLLERQSEELVEAMHGVEVRLGTKIDAGKTEILGGIESAKVEIIREVRQTAARATANRLRQLPPPVGDFTGRKLELNELRDALGRGNVAISGVQGMGGVGKTALALVLAHELASEYPDGQIFIDLKGVGSQPLSGGDVMWHVVNSFEPEAKRPDDDSLRSIYRSMLAEKRVLLVYDNAKDAALVAPLLPPASCLLLITSRKHFTLPGMHSTDLHRMTEADAVQLLLTIAPRIDNLAPEIAEQCGRLPIALRAAASAVKVKYALTPEEYLRRLREAKQRLELHDPANDQTVEACLGLSYEMLDDEMARRWRVLAVFPDTFDAAAAAAIWEIEVADAQEVLESLEEFSLLEFDSVTKRYSLHDLARDYAGAKMEIAEKGGVRFLHARHFLHVLETADKFYLKGNETLGQGLALYDLESANVTAGQAWSAGARSDANAQRLCMKYPNAGVYVLDLRLHSREQIDWLEAALDAARALGEKSYEGNYLGNLGLAYARLGDAHGAIEHQQQALAVAREIGDRRVEAASLGNLGLTYVDLGDARAAIKHHEQALTIAREIGDRRGEGNHLGNLGLAYADLGDAQAAIEHHQQALTISRAIGDRRGEGQDLGNLGSAYAALGDARAAIEQYELALAIAREIGDYRGEGKRLGNLGQAYLRLGETERAIASMEAAEMIFDAIQSPNGLVVREWLEELRGKSDG